MLENQKSGDIPIINDHIDSTSGPKLTKTLRGESLIKHLESLSTPCGENRRQSPFSESSNLQSYSMGFAHLDIPKLIKGLKEDFLGEAFIAADIGGSYGTAAKNLESAGCDRCFVIDPHDFRSKSSPQLPENQFIARRAEDMHEIPDECFQFLISFNTLTYSNDLSKALSEICRVLRPGGVALVDIEWWSQGKDLETLANLTLAPDTGMNLLHLDRKNSNISLVPLEKALNIAKSADREKALMLTMILGSGFIIQKALGEAS